MESPEGFANAILQARLNSAKRDAGGWEDEFYKERDARNRLAAKTWHWWAIFTALRSVFWVLAKRYPNDPLFKTTGRKRPDGSPELEYQRLFDTNLQAAVKEFPATTSRGADFQRLVQKYKI